MIVSTWSNSWSSGTTVELENRTRLRGRGVWGEVGDTIRVVPISAFDPYEGRTYTFRPGVER